MKFKRYHILAVETRLQEYEDVLAAETFTPLGICEVCLTAPRSVGGYCPCLFQNPAQPKDYCDGPRCVTGYSCTTRTQQRRQFKQLLRLLGTNGYQFG